MNERTSTQEGEASGAAGSRGEGEQAGPPHSQTQNQGEGSTDSSEYNTLYRTRSSRVFLIYTQLKTVNM